MSRDYALEESTGVVRAHKANCPTVRLLADAGEPVMTLLGCERELPADMPRHTCLAPSMASQRRSRRRK